MTEIPALAITGLSHSFKKHKALDEVSFEVQAGAIHGFVGPNGAGKTTTLRVVSTLMPPQEGSVQVFGMDIRKEIRRVRQSLGFMPDHFSMYRRMRVAEYLDFFAAAYGIERRARETTVSDVLSLTDMGGRRDALISSLSRGMQQRVGLARILVNDPALLLLDEPASGLDPRARIELMEIIRELRNLGKTIFISSHILSELADLCDHVTIIDRGKLRYTGTMAELLTGSKGLREFELGFISTDTELVSDALGLVPGVAEVRAGANASRLLVSFDPDRCRPSTLLQALLSRDIEVELFRPSERRLDEVFMDLTEPGVRQ